MMMTIIIIIIIIIIRGCFLAGRLQCEDYYCTSYPLIRYVPQIKNQNWIVGIIFLKPSNHTDLLPHPWYHSCMTIRILFKSYEFFTDCFLWQNNKQPIVTSSFALSKPMQFTLVWHVKEHSPQSTSFTLTTNWQQSKYSVLNFTSRTAKRNERVCYVWCLSASQRIPSAVSWRHVTQNNVHVRSIIHHTVLFTPTYVTQSDENDSNTGGNDVLLHLGNFLSSHMKNPKLLRMVTSFRTNIKLEFLPSLQDPLDKDDIRSFRERKNLLSLAVETPIIQPAA